MTADLDQEHPLVRKQRAEALLTAAARWQGQQLTAVLLVVAGVIVLSFHNPGLGGLLFVFGGFMLAPAGIMRGRYERDLRNFTDKYNETPREALTR